MSEIPLTHRWVASEGSARSATAAYLGFAARSRRLLVVMGLTWLACAVWFGVMFNEPASLASRLVWGPVFALVPAALAYVLVLTIGYVQTSRSFRQRLRPGVELASGFGADSVLLKGPSGEHRLAHDWLAWVRPRGDWVLVQQRATPVVSVWPRALFPDEHLARLSGGPLPRSARSAEERVEGDRDEEQ